MERQEEFKRNEKLEELLKEINSILQPPEDKILENCIMPKYPVILVVGAPRCGSTLTMQWLASTGQISYPTNILSRFYGAPYIGAKIQLLLTAPEYNFNNEILDFAREVTFTSNLGKTRGALAPNEFFYFWRRFIPNALPRHLSDDDLQKIDAKKMAAELAALETAFGMPFATKGAFLQFNIPAFSALFEKTLFLWVNRHPFFNAQSLLEAREKYYGDRGAWYSMKPKEYNELINLDAFSQVTGQIYYTNRAIEQGIAKIEDCRSLRVPYEELCKNPQKIYQQIADKLADQGCEIDRDYIGPKEFQDTNQVRVKSADCEKIAMAYRKITGETTEPIPPA